jgi:hypothetical protein
VDNFPRRNDRAAVDSPQPLMIQRFTVADATREKIKFYSRPISAKAAPKAAGILPFVASGSARVKRRFIPAPQPPGLSWADPFLSKPKCPAGRCKPA